MSSPKDDAKNGDGEPDDRPVIDDKEVALQGQAESAPADAVQGIGSNAPPETAATNNDSKSGDGNGDKDGDGDGDDTNKPMSKKQLKRKRKWERAMEVKERRKRQDKEIKIAKAKAEGRDLEKERLEQLQREQDGAGRRYRQERWEKEKLPLIEKSFQVCMDCSFESQMTAKEINSLSSQIRYCYSSNKRNKHPCKLTITSLTDSGPTMANLKNVSGFEDWKLRAFDYSDQSLEEVFSSRLNDIVYLTSDAQDVVEHLEDDKIYVIGGIVDRNRLHRAAIDRAEALSVKTAKLPIETHLAKMKSSKVLTCNHVFDILLKYREHGRNWEKALLEVLPSRKEASAKQEETGDQEECGK